MYHFRGCSLVYAKLSFIFTDILNRGGHTLLARVNVSFSRMYRAFFRLCKKIYRIFLPDRNVILLLSNPEHDPVTGPTFLVCRIQNVLMRILRSVTLPCSRNNNQYFFINRFNQSRKTCFL